MNVTWIALGPMVNFISEPTTASPARFPNQISNQDAQTNFMDPPVGHAPYALILAEIMLSQLVLSLSKI